MTAAPLQDPTPQTLLENHIEFFLQDLRVAGYAVRTLRKKRSVAKAFVHWAERKQIALGDLNDDFPRALAATAQGLCEV